MLAVAGLMLGLVGLTGCASTQSTAETEPTAARGDEEVNIGYGTKERGKVTGSVSSVPVEEAQRRRVVTNLSDLIEGNVSGVDVQPVAGGGLRIRIRGVNSLVGSNDPLYIVDGIALRPNASGVLDAVNPTDVKSITVLKGAAAAIYGARGANGVVVIETK